MKKHIFSYLVVTVIVLLTVLMSCDKKEAPVDVGVKLLDTETSGLYHSRKFIYDSQNRMKEIWTYSGGKLYEKAIITYAGKDLTKLEYAYLDEDGEFVVVDTRNYIKKGNTISYSMGVEIIEGEGEGNQNFNITITLNNDGFPVKLEEVLFNITSVSTFVYVDGNLTKHLYDTGFSSLLNDPGEKNYTYGVERSVFSGCNTPKWFMFLNYFEMASHNAVTSSSFPNGTPYSSYSYEFDHDGFPAKIFYGTGDVTEYKYKN
jgi:hypothetical protein